MSPASDATCAKCGAATRAIVLQHPILLALVLLVCLGIVGGLGSFASDPASDADDLRKREFHELAELKGEAAEFAGQVEETIRYALAHKEGAGWIATDRVAAPLRCEFLYDGAVPAAEAPTTSRRPIRQWAEQMAPWAKQRKLQAADPLQRLATLNSLAALRNLYLLREIAGAALRDAELLRMSPLPKRPLALRALAWLGALLVGLLGLVIFLGAFGRTCPKCV